MTRNFPFLFVFLLSLSCVDGVHAQSQPAGTSQVGPGDTSTIDHGKKTPAPDKPHRMLNDALTPQTRSRLQKAMDASPTPEPSH